MSRELGKHATPAAARAALWYHGGRRLHRGDPIQWDRDRTTSSLNEEGPGMYFTTSFDEAAGYVDRSDGGGGCIYRMKLPAGFVLVPKKRPSLVTLVELYKSASADDQEIFLSNWPDADGDPREALSHYARQTTLHDACVSLYGDLFRYHAEDYLEGMSLLGFDGVSLQKGTTGGSTPRLHLVAWSLHKLTLEES